jgi:hypothetical protein
MYFIYCTYTRSTEPRLTAVGIRCDDHATSSTHAKFGTTFADKRRWLVGIVCLRTNSQQILEFVYYLRFEVFTAVTMKNAVLWDVTHAACVGC